VHTFFLFVIVMQLARLCISITQTVLYSHNRHSDDSVSPTILQLDSVNILCELLFNLLILYYFLSIFEQPKP
jgi:hypothetical protein